MCSFFALCWLQGELPRLLRAARAGREGHEGLRSSMRLGPVQPTTADLAEQRAMMQDVSFFLILCGWLGVVLFGLIFLFLLDTMEVFKSSRQILRD